MKTVIIGVAGGTGSGKSTFTNRLKGEFEDQITVIYHDNYYKPHDDIPFDQRKSINYDHPDSLETDLLVKHVQELKAGKSVICPVYDYTQHTRSNKTVVIHPSKVIIIEGILVLVDKRLRDLCDIKIYTEADADERILRRAIRDVEERGRDLQDIARQYLATVKPMHYIYVEPTKALADVVINSGMNNVAFDLVKTKIETLIKERE